jgi:hypothetical protein
MPLVVRSAARRNSVSSNSSAVLAASGKGI